MGLQIKMKIPGPLFKNDWEFQDGDSRALKPAQGPFYALRGKGVGGGSVCLLRSQALEACVLCIDSSVLITF